MSCLLDRSSRPTRSPRRLAPEAERAICECRRKTGWGPRPVAGATGFCHSTVWKVLRRFGLSRPPRPAREPANRYEWPCPGDLLHLDVSRYARFLRPGHRVTGDRSRTSAEIESRVGYDYVHAVVDDHSRLAYAEIHRRAGGHGRRLPRGGARLLPSAWDRYEARDDGQCLRLRPQPCLPRAARPPRHAPFADRALSAAHERQGRALPPNDGQGVGVRARLPLSSRARASPATLATPLQPRAAAQLARRHVPDQPRSQRLWVGQLAVGGATRRDDRPEGSLLKSFGRASLAAARIRREPA